MQVQRQIDELLALRASEWLELLPTASTEQLRELEAWLSESRRHVQEFLEIAEVEYRLGNLDPERRQNVDLLLERIAPNLTPLPRRVAAGPFSSPAGMRHWKVIGTLAASALVALAAVLLLRNPAHSNQYVTAPGEQRVVELADTSVVTLNTDSEIEVRLQSSRREIELRRGEAIFKVTHDPERPFRVHTRAGIVQAVGTQFNVHDRDNGDTRVSVLEGRVRLTTSSQSTGLMLGVGEEADIHLNGTIERHEHAVVANTVAWRQRRLVFDNTPLEEMVAEFNRYNGSMHLRLKDVEGKTRRYDGTFDAADPESFLALLTREPDLQVERRDGEIVVRPKAQ
jgi:transmembrane sensor